MSRRVTKNIRLKTDIFLIFLLRLIVFVSVLRSLGYESNPREVGASNQRESTGDRNKLRVRFKVSGFINQPRRDGEYQAFYEQPPTKEADDNFSEGIPNGVNVDVGDTGGDRNHTE